MLFSGLGSWMNKAGLLIWREMESLLVDLELFLGFSLKTL